MKKRIDCRWIFVLTFIGIIIVVAIIINNNLGIQNAGISALRIDEDDLKIDWNKYATYEIELKEALSINKSGTYIITGQLYDGGITVNVIEGEVKIILKNTTIKNPDGPAIVCLEGEDLVIESIGENFLEDGSTYGSQFDQDTNGVIYSKADLTLQGDGLIKVISNFQDGIVSKDDLNIRSGAYDIVSKDDAIRGKDSVYIENGKITIDSKADGIKSTNDEDSGKGFVYIKSGDISIGAGDDGIHAEKQLIIDDGNINMIKSYEGLEAPIITINAGTVSIKSSDDGINAGSGDSASNTPRPAGRMDADEKCVLTINGGNIYINSSGDGMDSNGYIYINDGKVIVDGPTRNANGALDAGISIVMNGGELIAIGSNMMAENPNPESSIYNASIFLNETAKANSEIVIKNDAGETIVTHTSAKQFNHITAASSKFEQGKTYTLYLNNKKTESFTIYNKTTTVGGKFNLNNYRK